MQCAGLALSLPLSMDPDGQREELGSCTCEVTMMVATSVTCILREADPVSLLDFGKFFAVAKVWDGYIEKLCEKAFKSEGEGHGEGGGE